MKRLLFLLLAGILVALSAAAEERPIVPSERIAALSIVPPLAETDYTNLAMADGRQ